MDQKTVVDLHSGILCSSKKEGTLILCDSMDGPGEYYAKWNKPVSERSHLHVESNKHNKLGTKIETEA